MTRKQKNQKFDETVWSAVAMNLGLWFKSKKKGGVSKRNLRKSLECEICAEWFFLGLGFNQESWRKLISILIDLAKKHGYSTELFEHWLNNRDGTSHGHFLTLTPQEVQEMFETAFPKG